MIKLPTLTHSPINLFRLGDIQLDGPCSLLGKGSFGYALKCYHNSHPIVLKIDTKRKYALWDALVQWQVIQQNFVEVIVWSRLLLD